MNEGWVSPGDWAGKHTCKNFLKLVFISEVNNWSHVSLSVRLYQITKRGGRGRKKSEGRLKRELNESPVLYLYK